METSGARFPGLYSIFEILPSPVRPYSTMYISPFGPNSVSIGLRKVSLGAKRSIATTLSLASFIVTAKIQFRT